MSTERLQQVTAALGDRYRDYEALMREVERRWRAIEV
jgi:hypothetical protein